MSRNSEFVASSSLLPFGISAISGVSTVSTDDCGDPSLDFNVSSQSVSAYHSVELNSPMNASDPLMSLRERTRGSGRKASHRVRGGDADLSIRSAGSKSLREGRFTDSLDWSQREQQSTTSQPLFQPAGSTSSESRKQATFLPEDPVHSKGEPHHRMRTSSDAPSEMSGVLSLRIPTSVDSCSPERPLTSSGPKGTRSAWPVALQVENLIATAPRTSSGLRRRRSKMDDPALAANAGGLRNASQSVGTEDDDPSTRREDGEKLRLLPDFGSPAQGGKRASSEVAHGAGVPPSGVRPNESVRDSKSGSGIRTEDGVQTHYPQSEDHFLNRARRRSSPSNDYSDSLEGEPSQTNRQQQSGSRSTTTTGGSSEQTNIPVASRLDSTAPQNGSQRDHTDRMNASTAICAFSIVDDFDSPASPSEVKEEVKVPPSNQASNGQAFTKNGAGGRLLPTSSGILVRGGASRASSVGFSLRERHSHIVPRTTETTSNDDDGDAHNGEYRLPHVLFPPGAPNESLTPTTTEKRTSDTTLGRTADSNLAPKLSSILVRNILSFDVRTALVVPYMVCLVVVSTAILCTTYFVLNDTLETTVKNAHGSLGRQVRSVVLSVVEQPETVSIAMTSMYIRNTTRPRSNDALFPITSAMYTEICSTIENADRSKYLRFLSVASLTRNVGAMCYQRRNSSSPMTVTYSKHSMSGDLSTVNSSFLDSEPWKPMNWTREIIDGSMPPTAPGSSKNHAEDGYVTWDRAGLYTLIGTPISIVDFSRMASLYEIIDPWMEAMRKRERYTGGYWVKQNDAPTELVYVLPFLEKLVPASATEEEPDEWSNLPPPYMSKRNNTVRGYGVGFVASGLLYESILQSLHMNDLIAPGMKHVLVAVVMPGTTTPIVVANNWGQPVVTPEEFHSETILDNGTNISSIEIVYKNTSLWDVTKPLLLQGFKKLRLDELTRSTDDLITNATFMYHWSIGIISLQRTTTTGGLTVYMILGTSAYAVIGRTYARILIIGIFLIVLIVLIGVGLFFLVTYTMTRPLNNVRILLERAAVAADVDKSTDATGRGRGHIREILLARQECIDLNRRLQEVRAYLPPGLVTFDEGLETSISSICSTATESHHQASMTASATYHAGGTHSSRPSSPILPIKRGVGRKEIIAHRVLDAGRDNTNQFRRRLCTLLFIYCPIFNSGPTFTPFIGDLMKAVINTANSYGGCIESLQPDRITISFGARQKLRTHGLLAAQCALTISRAIPSSLRSYVAFIADTHRFFYGTCGDEVRKALVVFGRDVSTVIGPLQLHIRASVCLTEECAKLVGDKLRILPVEVLTINPTSDSVTAMVGTGRGQTNMILFEVLPGSSVTREWLSFYRGYTLGFSAMEQGRYADALKLFPSKAAFDAVVEAANPEANPLENNTSPMILDWAAASYRNYDADETPNQLTRLTTECMERVNKGATAPYHRAPHNEDCDKSATLCSFNQFPSMWNGDMSSGDHPLVKLLHTPRTAETSLLGNTIRCVLGSSKEQAVSTVFYCGSTTLHLDLTITDVNGVQWRRAKDLMHSSSYSPSFLAISSTGTLAFMKVYDKAFSIGHTRLHNSVRTLFLKETSEMASGGSALSREPNPMINFAGDNDLDARDAGVDAVPVAQSAGLVRCISTAETSSAFIVLYEYVPGGSLSELVGHYGQVLPRAMVLRFLHSMLRTLRVMEENGIVHGQIQMQNVLVSASGECKLKDVDIEANLHRLRALLSSRRKKEGGAPGNTGVPIPGYLKPKNTGNQKSVANLSPGMNVANMTYIDSDPMLPCITEFPSGDVGLDHMSSMVYTSPEVIKGAPRKSSSDVFAVGMVALRILSGKNPWQWTSLARVTRSQNELIALFTERETFVAAVANGDVEPLEIPELPQEVTWLLSAMCNVNPLDRPNAQQCIDMLLNLFD